MSRPPGHYKIARKTDLTPRQREVLELIARGRTNGEIAEHLGITLDGAKWHVSEILNRLGVASREEAAEWYRDQNRRRLPRLRGLIPGWLMKAGAGAGAAGVAGIVSLALFTGGEDPSPASPDEACTLHTLDMVHRQLPESDNSVRLELQLTSASDCQLQGSLLLRIRPSTGRTGSPDDQALARTITTASTPLRAGTPHTISYRWSNWCHQAGPDDHVIVDMYVLDHTANPSLPGARTAGSDMRAAVVPECAAPASPSLLTEVQEDYRIRTDLPECNPTNVVSRIEQRIDPAGEFVFDWFVRGTTGECDLIGEVGASVGRGFGGYGWGSAANWQTLRVPVDGSVQQPLTGVWREWCYQDLQAFIEVNFVFGASAGAIHQAQAVERQPGCSTTVVPGRFVVDLGPPVEVAILTGAATLPCTASPGCGPVLDLLGPDPALNVRHLLETAPNFRKMGDQDFPIAIERAEFEALAGELLRSTSIRLIAIGCSDKDGPGTCIAMDLVFQRADGRAFGLAFDNASGTPVLFGVTPEIDLSALDTRRQAIFGTANYVTLEQPIAVNVIP